MFSRMTSNKRQSHRDPMTGTTCMVRLDNGTTFEGVVRDVSDGGIGVIGATDGLMPGDEVGLMLVVGGDQRVGCRCDVRHTDERSYGLAYREALQPVTDTRVTFCPQCDRHFDPDYRFCGYCGSHLKSRTVPLDGTR